MHAMMPSFPASTFHTMHYALFEWLTGGSAAKLCTIIISVGNENKADLD